MDFVYQQIGLSDDSLKETVSNLALEVLNELHGYADNHPVNISSESYDENELSQALKLLKQNKIILYKQYDSESFYGYRVVVINRYKFELLSAELTWLESPQEEETPKILHLLQTMSCITT